MKKPVLLIMAAGMGSRYGGLKQMDPVGPNGELIIDFSLYDAWKAGFEKAVFVIKREMEQDFRALMDDRAAALQSSRVSSQSSVVLKFCRFYFLYDSVVAFGEAFNLAEDPV